MLCSTATALGRAAADVTDRYGGYCKVTGAVPATCTRRRLYSRARALANTTNGTNRTNGTGNVTANKTPVVPTTSKVVIYV